MKNEWISVKDRLPDSKSKYEWISIPVIIAMDITTMPVLGCFYSLSEGFHTDEGLEYDNVTHWMPLPKPPKKQRT